mmetsp:Transcript_87608/g.246089  ORF Transcript_87608/g.246089 Transcript_87608/m.246089 type:complete len:179 (+) Transcript_87608:902-1438(+)
MVHCATPFGKPGDSKNLWALSLNWCWSWDLATGVLSSSRPTVGQSRAPIGLGASFPPAAAVPPASRARVWKQAALSVGAKDGGLGGGALGSSDIGGEDGGGWGMAQTDDVGKEASIGKGSGGTEEKCCADRAGDGGQGTPPGKNGGGDDGGLGMVRTDTVVDFAAAALAGGAVANNIP